MTEVRDLIIALTLSGLLLLFLDRPSPSRLVQTDYCVITKRVAAKDPITGEWMRGWAPMYAPCSEQPDIYRQI